MLLVTIQYFFTAIPFALIPLLINIYYTGLPVDPPLFHSLYFSFISKIFNANNLFVNEIIDYITFDYWGKDVASYSEIIISKTLIKKVIIRTLSLYFFPILLFSILRKNNSFYLKNFIFISLIMCLVYLFLPPGYYGNRYNVWILPYLAILFHMFLFEIETHCNRINNYFK